MYRRFEDGSWYSPFMPCTFPDGLIITGFVMLFTSSCITALSFKMSDEMAGEIPAIYTRIFGSGVKGVFCDFFETYEPSTITTL